MALTNANTSLTVTQTQSRGSSTSFQPITSQITSNPQYTVGTGTDQADVPYNKTLSVTAGADLEIDLSGGTIKMDDDTTTASFAVLTRCTIQQNSAGTLTVGGASAPVPNISWVGYGSGATYHNEYAGAGGIATVTATTADKLKFSAASGTIYFTILLLGRSA